MNLSSLRKPKRALLLFLGAGVSLTTTMPAFAQTPAAPEQPKEEALSLTRFEVTGSRIKGIDMETALPVIRYTTDSVNLDGATNVGDALRNLPFNAGGNIDPQRTSTFATGARTINLRGLGSRNTLVLLNGRRIAGYGLAGGNGFDSVADLNSVIPDSAIQEIDVLKDGASAIYGSDAVAGVVNIITKRDFNGLNITTKVGNTTNKDQFLKEGSVTFGTTSGKTQIMGTATWSQSNGSKLQDQGFSRTANLTYFGGSNAKSSLPYPGYVVVPRTVAPGLPGTGSTVRVTYNSPTTTPTVAGAVPYNTLVNNYDPNPLTDLLPPFRNYGAFFTARHEITDSLYFFTELGFVKQQSKIVVAASPISGGAENGTSSTGHILFPLTNPYNPFGVDISDSNIAFRLVEIGGRTTDLDVTAPRLLVGIGGTIATKWDWESTASYSASDISVVNSNQALDRQVQAALNGVKGNLTGRTLYHNPFGPNDPELVNMLRANFNRSAKADAKLYDLHVSGPLFDLPWSSGATVKGALGGEIRQEKVSSYRSSDEQTGQVIGGNEGFNTFGSRDVKSIYAEVIAPLAPRVELQLAERFEDYSDFGKTTKPKIAIGYRPTDWFLIRGSFSKTFKAADLAQLYNGGTVAFSSTPYQDTRRPDPAQQVKIVTIGNPKLKPEETDVYYAGIVIAPKKGGFLGALDGLSLSIDFFKFDGNNVITTFGYQTILLNETVSPLFGNLVVRGTPAAGETVGPLLNVNDSFLNVNSQSWKGCDIDLKYDVNTARFGRFSFESQWTYTHSIQFGGLEFVHSFTYPRVKSTTRLRWAYKDLEAATYAYYTSDYDDSGFASSGNTLLNKVQKHTSYDAYVRYHVLKQVSVKVGANNVLNSPPPRSYVNSPGYDNLTYSGQGRFVYTQIEFDL